MSVLDKIKALREKFPRAEQQLAAQRWLQGQYLELQSTLEQSAAAIEQRNADGHDGWHISVLPSR